MGLAGKYLILYIYDQLIMNSSHIRMIKELYKKNVSWVGTHRFQLLLTSTILVLVLPATSGGFLREILFVSSMSFLLIQSMIVATTRKSKRIWFRYFILLVIIVLIILEPAGYNSLVFETIRLLLLATFFVFVTLSLIRFLKKSKKIDGNVIIAAINIYLLIGIIAGSLAFLFYKAFPGAYNIPDYITDPNFVSFNYFSFVTMSTVGYGDITPRLPQTQTLAYLVAITGQLYVAIVIAFLVGKMLMHSDNNNPD
jgi:hypothetical protein